MTQKKKLRGREEPETNPNIDLATRGPEPYTILGYGEHGEKKEIGP